MKIKLESVIVVLTAVLAMASPTWSVPDVDIWKAAASGNIAASNQHVAAGAGLNVKEPSGGSTPLIVAALFGQTEAANLLIQKGANVNIKNNGMLITDCEYPPHILQQISVPSMYHGWYSLDKNRPNDVLYGTVNRKIWINCVSNKRDAYKDDKDLVYAGIFLNFINHKDV